MSVHNGPVAVAPVVPVQQDTLKLVLTSVLSIVVWAGVVVGVFFGCYALAPSINITIYLTIVIGLLVGIALAISMWGKTGSLNRALAMDMFLIISGLIILFAFLPQMRPHGPGIFMVVMAVLILIVILFAWRNPPILSWLINLYNPEKAFGGTTFGEFTSFLGVVGALGAHAALASDAVGWYWMGHYGILLAFAAGASQFWRWLRFEDDPVPAYLTLALVFFTLISLALTPNLSNWYEFVVWGLFIILSVAILIKVAVSSGTLRSANQWGAPPHAPIAGGQRVWLVIFTILICLVGLTFIVLFILSTLHVAIGDITYGAMALNTAGLICWVATEGWNIYQKSKEPWLIASNYQEWEKNIWNIFGGSTLIFFTLSPLWNHGPIPTEINYIFILGLVFGLVGTLRGIMLGLIKKYG